ncbi:MAG: KamA family radical SAM protein [Myxococcota bacterium]|jgi:lysine 2,3-aminomutase|nr:KamA family radical SAM protein [Myxococcota bacterium]
MQKSAPRQRIQKGAIATPWAQELAQAIARPEDLPEALAERIAPFANAQGLFPFKVTPYYLSLADPRDPRDPILLQCLPDAAELKERPGLELDPIAERRHSPLPGLVRRYPDRAALLLGRACAVHCRHCTRRHMGQGNIRGLDAAGLEDAIAFLRDHAEISDVLVTGGDPLLLDDEVLAHALSRLRSIQSVRVIRVGTRAPVTLPTRITPNLIKTLRRFGPLYVLTQFNHPREITSLSKIALGRLASAGLPVANQSVLLRGVNDDPEVMEELCRNLFGLRVRPYYLFLCDQWPGLEHLRTSFDAALAVSEHLRGRLSGLAIPQLVVDLPGGLGKVPVGPDYVVRREPGKVVLRAPSGERVEYLNPIVQEPAEKEA